jgi:hypothetical protein
MRTTLILLLALVAGTAFAQAPVIDSMLIDESKGILSVYGDFGTTQGKVWCDSVELPVLTWSASLVTATIPDTGKGSAGGVVVENIQDVSQPRQISLWYGSTSVFQQSRQHLEESSGRGLRFRVRMDLQSHVADTLFKVRSLALGRYSQQNGNESWGTPYDPKIGYNVSKGCDAWVNINYSDTAYISGFKAFVIFDAIKHKLVFYISNIKGIMGSLSYNDQKEQYHETYEYKVGDYTKTIKLDSFYNIIPYEETIDEGYYKNSYSDIGDQSFMPYNTIARKYDPSIISPKDDRTNLGTDDILLQWDTLKYMDTYHIQLSKDSIVNGQRAGQAQQGVAYIVDTIVSSLDFVLPPLEKNTKYYWRVCGVNTEGESRWSDVWSFTTGTSTDVKQERAKNTSLACYPNPATNELTIVTDEPTLLLLYDVTGKIIKSEHATSNQTKWDVSLLPNGTYILGTSSGEMQVVQIVK